MERNMELKQDMEKLKRYETFDEFIRDMEQSKPAKAPKPKEYLKGLVIALALIFGAILALGLALNFIF